MRGPIRPRPPRPPAPASPGADFAAALIGEIRRSAAIGRPPGLPGGLGAREQDEVDLALIMIMVWQLSARAETGPEENKLLALSLLLVCAIRADALGVIDDRDKLADILQNASAHL